MAYNPIQNFYINPGYADGHFVQWKLDPVFADSQPHKYTVDVAGTPDFSEIIYTLDVGDNFYVIDDTNHKQSFADDHWYRVKLETGDAKTYYSKSILLGATMATRRQWVMSAEIMRKELLRMRKFTGAAAWLLKRKNFGKESKSTIDPVSGAPIADNTSDFGVGLVDGYFNPLRIFITYEDIQQERKQDSGGMGVIETFTADIRMIGYPTVEIHDIIVDGDADKRYIIKKADPTFFPSTDIVLIQQLKGILIPNTDPVYDIDIKIESR